MVPLEALQANEMLDAVEPVTRTFPGVDGAPGVPLPPPPHGAPLRVQFAGLPEPAPMKPKTTLAPGAIVPL
jgi:hypothetical protein